MQNEIQKKLLILIHIKLKTNIIFSSIRMHIIFMELKYYNHYENIV